MRGEQQGQDECMLATVADLTNTKLSLVRATALAYSGKRTWTEVCNLSGGEVDSVWWKTVFYLCDCFDSSKKLAHALVQASSIRKSLAEQCSARSIAPFWAAMFGLPSNGKGVIVLVPSSLSPLTGHIVPWEDGLTYDSNILNNPGESLSIVKERYFKARGYVVQAISQL